MACQLPTTSRQTHVENQQNPAVLVLGTSSPIGRQVVEDLEGQAVNIRITSRNQEAVAPLTR